MRPHRLCLKTWAHAVRPYAANDSPDPPYLPNIKQILLAAPVHAILVQMLEDAGYVLLHRERISRAEALQEIRGCVGIVTANRLAVDAELMAAGESLQFIGRLGSGLEIIDLAAAAARGIAVFSSPEGNCNAVGEHALGLLLALTKNIVRSHGEVAAGAWRREENRGYELEGRTVGLLGYGHTGQAFAKKLAGFDVQVIAYDTNPNLQPRFAHVRMAHAITELYDADVLSFHVPLRDDTRNYFDENFLRAMRKPCWIVNTSRGEIVTMDALEKGLQSGHILGAGLDVLPGEPLGDMSAPERARVAAFSQNGRVILTPHIGGYSHEALYKMSLILAGKILSRNVS